MHGMSSNAPSFAVPTKKGAGRIIFERLLDDVGAA
jgi:hypothetical protein